MTTVTLQRAKCIGCNYCEEMAPELFRMSRKDGKSTLLHAHDAKGFHTVRLSGEDPAEKALRAAQACPVKIISVRTK
ncbi:MULTISPECIES: ferredoxin [unclassified Flavobacterium]|uniref:ferredoxin n=1 Tax=unclassified Flavobacterium TaxID=196869 RepID=UPI001F137DC2|nr:MULTISPECIES: ferredoxin [unclassified Flavobacterium]UMY66289.1 ferredoxin [Flavobacterium sp. HJ-32-4]